MFSLESVPSINRHLITIHGNVCGSIRFSTVHCSGTNSEFSTSTISGCLFSNAWMTQSFEKFKIVAFLHARSFDLYYYCTLINWYPSIFFLCLFNFHSSNLNQRLQSPIRFQSHTLIAKQVVFCNVQLYGNIIVRQYSIGNGNIYVNISAENKQNSSFELWNSHFLLDVHYHWVFLRCAPEFVVNDTLSGRNSYGYEHNRSSEEVVYTSNRGPVNRFEVDCDLSSDPYYAILRETHQLFMEMKTIFMEDITNATLFPASEEAFFSCVHSLVQLQRLVVMRYEN